jgi:hypothetical protein
VHNGAKQCTFQIGPTTPNTATLSTAAPATDLQPHAPLTPADPPLSSAQLAALPLILAGKSDTEVARTLGFHRNTINRWRTLELPFMARLNRMRASQDAQALDAIRAELPTAAATLIYYLTHGFAADRIRAATNLLRLAAVHRRLHNIGPQTVPELLHARAKLTAKSTPRRAPKRTPNAIPNSTTPPPQPAPPTPQDLRHILAQQLALELALEAPHELPEPPEAPKPPHARCPSPYARPAPRPFQSANDNPTDDPET